ncbi:beta-ketoacyl-ACP synthase II [Vallitaleaceae bacterium 9-2]
MRRVVVTGLGAITPIGLDAETYWNNLKEGVVGIGPITHFDTSDFTVKLAGEVKGFDPKEYMDRKNARKYDVFSQFAIAAAKEALKHSGLDLASEDLYRIGVIVASGIGGLGTMEKEEQKLIEKGPSRVSPSLIPKIITNMAAGNIAIEIGVKGINTNIVTACASATHSIGEAFRNIKYGVADAIFCGGTESSIVPLGIAGFANMTALSTNEDPNTASRPFDKERDGFVMGEGAGVLLLEEYEHAKARGANILAEIVGYGATCDAYHLTSPDPEGTGAGKAMEFAMAEARIEPKQVQYINAHGTSTPYNDHFETLAIKRAFGDHAYKLKVNSTKSMTGHLLGAAGGVEAVATVKTLVDQFIHPTMGYQTPDENCDLDYVPNQGIATTVEYAISNSLGFGGHNASLLFKRI